jgi:predicted dehydrogenase
MSRRTTRRTFMKGAAAAGAGFWVWNQRAYAQSKSPNEQIQIAWIGVGGKGSSDVDHAGKVGKVVAICDADSNMMAAKTEQFPDAEQFDDYRELIEKMGDKVDAVGVSTPDHNHYPAAMLAMKRKKHVYVQKPLTWSVWEARQLREMAAKHGLKTQMGNQGSASDGLRRGVEWIRAGVIGPVKEIHVWTNRPIWPQAPQIMERPPEAPKPEQLNWEAWLGPAPHRPYVKEFYHPFAWRGWLDFGTGALGDMACHTANLPFYATKLKYPTSVQAEAGDVNNETHPSWAHIVWDYPARGDMPPVKFHWYEGKRDKKDLVQPDRKLFPGLGSDKQLPASGALVIGEKGALFQTDDYGNSWHLLPEKDMKDVKGPEKSIPRHDGDIDQAMKKEWAAAIKGEIDQTFSNFGYAGVLTEAMLLGNVAIRNHGKRLEWDGEGMKFAGNEDAQKFVRRQAREGWDVTM